MGSRRKRINLPDMPDMMPDLDLPSSQELENQQSLMQQEQAGRMSVESTINPTAMQQTQPKGTLMAENAKKKSKKPKAQMANPSVMGIYGS